MYCGMGPSSHLLYEASSSNRSSVINNLCGDLHLGEAALEVLKENPDKTPISLLQELLSPWGMRPKYECVQTRGPVREPFFQYMIYLENAFIAIGSGRAKKEAKHAAAQNFIDLLVGNLTPAQANDTDGIPALRDVARNKFIFVDKIMGNPIGWLQQLCMWRELPMPEYYTEKEEGLPHQRQFTIACVVKHHKEIGSEKKKRLAKRMAAYKMWQTLQI